MSRDACDTHYVFLWELIFCLIHSIQPAENTLVIVPEDSIAHSCRKWSLKIVEILFSEGAKLDSRDNVSTYNNVMTLGYRTYM